MIDCQSFGLLWQPTTSCGWFRCGRPVDRRESKKWPSSSVVTYCHKVVHCPGCLGYIVQGVDAIFCTWHAGCCIEAFQVMPLQSLLEPVVSEKFQQSSLW